MPKKEPKFVGTPPCENCGGTHYGTHECPYKKLPCVVCGDETIWACADCAIDRPKEYMEHSGNVTHVCEKPTCRDEHEKAHPNVVHV